MFRTRHFVVGDFEKKSVFLPDREYGLALDALVKGCADVLITQEIDGEFRVLLGRRCVEPQPDWWFVGGRTRPGDTPEEGAARNVKRETGLAVEPSRFRVVGNYSFVWKMRQQAPATNGTADISTVLELRLTPDESIDFECFAKSEYRGAKWTSWRDILKGDFNPALQQAVRDLMTLYAFDELREMCSHPAAPSFLVADKAKKLVEWHESAPSNEPVKVVYDAQNETYLFKNIETDEITPRPHTTIPSEDDFEKKKKKLLQLGLPIFGMRILFHHHHMTPMFLSPQVPPSSSSSLPLAAHAAAVQSKRTRLLSSCVAARNSNPSISRSAFPPLKCIST